MLDQVPDTTNILENFSEAAFQLFGPSDSADLAPLGLCLVARTHMLG